MQKCHIYLYLINIVLTKQLPPFLSVRKCKWPLILSISWPLCMTIFDQSQCRQLTVLFLLYWFTALKTSRYVVHQLHFKTVRLWIQTHTAICIFGRIGFQLSRLHIHNVCIHELYTVNTQYISYINYNESDIYCMYFNYNLWSIWSLFHCVDLLKLSL